MYFPLNSTTQKVTFSKFDAVKLSHLVDAEYGNQGIDFKMVPREGFGWMNCKLLPTDPSEPACQTAVFSTAAYQVGLSFLTTHMRRAVAACTSPEVFFGAGVSGVSGDAGLMNNNPMSTDPLGLAMESLNLASV